MKNKIIDALNNLELDALKTMYLNRHNYIISCESNEDINDLNPHIEDIMLEWTQVYDAILEEDGNQEIFDAGIYYAVQEIKKLIS